MSTLLIDDVRDLKVDRIARNYTEGLEALLEEEWEVLYLDYDLTSFSSSGYELTGYDILEWILDNPEHAPGRVEVVTQNPVAKRRMEALVSQIEKLTKAKWVRYKTSALVGGDCAICKKPIKLSDLTLDSSETDKAVFLNLPRHGYAHLKHAGISDLFAKVIKDLEIDVSEKADFLK